MANIAVGVALGVGTLASLGLAVGGMVMAKKENKQFKHALVELVKELDRDAQKTKDDIQRVAERETDPKLRSTLSTLSRKIEEEIKKIKSKRDLDHSELEKTIEAITQAMKSTEKRIETQEGKALQFDQLEEKYQRLSRMIRRPIEKMNEILRRLEMEPYAGEPAPDDQQ